MSCIVYGDEQMFAVLRSMKSSGGFKFKTHYLKPGYDIEKIPENADLLIIQITPEMKEKPSKIVSELIRRFPNRRRLIIPKCRFRAYHPELRKLKDENGNDLGKGPRFHDINTMKWWKYRSIFADHPVTSPDFYNEKDIRDLAKREISIMQRFENVGVMGLKPDINLWHIIRNTHFSIELFHVSDIPTVYLCNRIAQLILDKLGIYEPCMSVADPMKRLSFPIYTSVYRALGCSFVNPPVYTINGTEHDVNEMVKKFNTFYSQLMPASVDINLGEKNDIYDDNRFLGSIPSDMSTGKDGLCILYGNCQMISLAIDLSSNKEFFKKYGYPVVVKVYTLKEDEKEQVRDLVSNADLVISHKISDRYKEFSSQSIRSMTKGKFIEIPNCHFSAQYPELTYIKDSSGNRINKYGVVYHVKSLILSYPDRPKNPYQLRIESEETYTKCIEELRRRESDIDIKISDYIESNWKCNKLFHTFDHPTLILVKHISSQILKHLSMKTKTPNVFDPLSFKSFPVRRDVMERYDLKFEDSGKFVRYRHSRSWEEYVDFMFKVYSEMSPKTIEKIKKDM